MERTSDANSRIRPVSQSQLIFRDGVDTDIPYCLALDSDFQSEHVWQMTVQEIGDEIQVNCRKQRLPRQLQSRHVTDPHHLEISPAAPILLCCCSRQRAAITFSAMFQCELTRGARSAYLQDIVIDRPYRRRSLGSRLVHVARVWAGEYESAARFSLRSPRLISPASSLPRPLGFSFCGFNDHHFANREIAIFFSLSV